jgi:hypothetical protein
MFDRDPDRPRRGGDMAGEEGVLLGRKTDCVGADGGVPAIDLLAAGSCRQLGDESVERIGDGAGDHDFVR